MFQFPWKHLKRKGSEGAIVIYVRLCYKPEILNRILVCNSQANKPEYPGILLSAVERHQFFPLRSRFWSFIWWGELLLDQAKLSLTPQTILFRKGGIQIQKNIKSEMKIYDIFPLVIGFTLRKDPDSNCAPLLLPATLNVRAQKGKPVS